MTAESEGSFSTNDGLTGQFLEGEEGMELYLQWEEGSRWECLEAMDPEDVVEMVVTALVDLVKDCAEVLEEEGENEEALRVQEELEGALSVMSCQEEAA